MTSWLRFLGWIVIILGIIGGLFLLFADARDLPGGQALTIAIGAYDLSSDWQVRQLLKPAADAARLQVTIWRMTGASSIISALVVGSLLIALGSTIECLRDTRSLLVRLARRLAPADE